MPAPTLTALCMKACIKNAANIRDIGSFEYWKIRPALLRITNPEQLHEIELASPQILGEDAELWKAFIARDIPSSRLIKDLKPKDPFKWWELYLEYLEEEHRAIERDTERLRIAMMGIQKVKEKNVSKVMAAKYLPKQPKDRRMLANDGGVPITRQASASTIRNTRNSSKLFTKVKREAKVISSRTRFNVSPQRLPVGTSQIIKAPKAMLADYRRAVMPKRKIYPATKTTPKTSNAQSLAEREKRLRGLTASSCTIESASRGMDSSEYGSDDLFGERKSSPVSPPTEKYVSARETQQRLSLKTARPIQATKAMPDLRSLPAARSKDVRLTNATSTVSFEGNRKQSSQQTSVITELKPSDIISSIISRPKQQQSPPDQMAPMPKLPSISRPKSERSSPTQEAPSAGKSTSSPPSRLLGPASADIVTTTPSSKGSPPRRPTYPQPGVIIRKRVVEVDIFNKTGTAAKKSRVK